MKNKKLRGVTFLLAGCLLIVGIGLPYDGFNETVYAEELKEEEDIVNSNDVDLSESYDAGTNENSQEVSSESDTDQEQTESESEEKEEVIKKTLRVNQKWTMNQWLIGELKWKSSNKKVATVNSNAVVTAKKVGTANIYAKNGNITYICKLTVKKSNFKPVALKKLANYKSLKQKMTDKQFKKAYNKALKIVKPLGDLSKKEQLMGVATALRELFDNGMDYSMSSPHYNDPYGYLVLKSASCAGCTRATGLCLNILGIKYEHVNEGKYSHQWVRVKVGKNYWICDAYGLYCGPEPGVRKHPYF